MESRTPTNPDLHEVELHAANGMIFLLGNLLLMFAWLAVLILSIVALSQNGSSLLGILMLVLSVLYLFLIGPILFGGLKVLKPNEALVLTLFGRYVGTLKGPGFYFVNPFCSAVNPAAGTQAATTASFSIDSPTAAASSPSAARGNVTLPSLSKKISLKTLTLNNDRQKINDKLGNPVIIGIAVVWRIVDTAQAVFNVDNYKEFLSIQCDSALRDIVRLYPYDAAGDSEEKSLRGSSQEISERLRSEIQARVAFAGLEILEARITQLAYAPEIASAMLQRQQAAAIIDARQMIVEGAVGMVEMALSKLSEQQIVQLDEERKAAMVSNLLVVLCANRDAQPIVNSGSLY